MMLNKKYHWTIKPLPLSMINLKIIKKDRKLEPATHTNPSSLGEGPPCVPLGTKTAMPPRNLRKDFLPESSVGFWQRAT